MNNNTFMSRSGFFNLLFIIGVLLSITIFNSCTKQTTTTDSSSEPVYDRIIKTRTIKCGYVSNPPSCVIEPNSKQVSGIFVDAMNIIAQKMNVKIEWSEEVGFGSMIEGLKTGRYDMVPCAIWPNTQRAESVDFTNPLFYSAVCAYVREDDNRFTNNLKAIDSPDIIISTMDGEMAQVIAKADFSKAKTLEVPQLSEISTMLLNVKNKKADVTFVELYFANQFLKNNPGSIKNITLDKPIRVFPNTIMINKGEFKLKSWLNIAIEELVNTGVADNLIAKYEPAPGTFYRLETPYHVPIK